MNRDPHLPPPEVVDWLLERDWSDMIPVSLIQYHGSAPHGMTQSKLYEYQQAHAELGSNDSARILIPVETLEVLKADQEARRETTLPDPNRPLPPPDDSEMKLLRKILAEAEKADHSAMATIGVFVTAAILMASQTLNLAYQPDETEEAQP